MQIDNIVQIVEKSKYANYITILAYIIDACNYSCSYCYNHKPRSNKELDLSLIVNLCMHLYDKTHKNIKLELIGGEPTLHSKLLDFVNKISSLSYVDVFILTNLSQSYQYYNMLLSLNFNIVATWHSLPNDAKNIGFITTLDNIDKQMIDNGMVDIRIMVEHSRFKESCNVFSQLSLNPSYKKHMQCGLISYGSYDKSSYTSNQLKVFEKMQSKIDYNKLVEYDICYLDGHHEFIGFNDMFLDDSLSFNRWLCNAGKDYLYVHVNGSIYPCETYFYEKMQPVSNIYCINNIQMRNTLCRCKFCTSCDFGIKKCRIFK